MRPSCPLDVQQGVPVTRFLAQPARRRRGSGCSEPPCLCVPVCVRVCPRVCLCVHPYVCLCVPACARAPLRVCIPGCVCLWSVLLLTSLHAGHWGP